MGRKGLRKYLALVVLLTGCGVGIGDRIWAQQLQRSAVQMKEKTDRNQTGERTDGVILEKNVEAVSVTDIVRVEDNEKKKDKFVAENTGIAVVVNAGTEQFEQEIPVLRVKPHEFTAGDLKVWHDALFPDITLYEYFGIEERQAAYQYMLLLTAGTMRESGGKHHCLLWMRKRRLDLQCFQRSI